MGGLAPAEILISCEETGSNAVIGDLHHALAAGAMTRGGYRQIGPEIDNRCPTVTSSISNSEHIAA
jgi:hypothetical protein